MLGQHQAPLLQLQPPDDDEEKLANGNDSLSVVVAEAASAAKTANKCSVSAQIAYADSMDNCSGHELQPPRMHGQLPPPQQGTPTPSTTFLASMSQCWAKTKKDLDRSGCMHVLWILVMVFYSLLGALLFKLLDGEASDAALAKYRNRCADIREESLRQLMANCSGAGVAFDYCKHDVRKLVMQVDSCLRDSPPLMSIYSTSDFGNALIYAISIYTTIGYGTISVNSVSGQMVSILYALIGIPLFFALIADLGQVFQRFFIKAFRGGRHLLHATVFFRRFEHCKALATVDRQADAKKRPLTNGEHNSSREMALIFAWAVGLLVLYFVGVSIVFATMERWELTKSFYFLFQSIALIGLGDVFPNKPACLLINVAFIMLGIVLLSMCFFILQQKIRKKTSDWSRRMQHSMHSWRYLQNSCQAGGPLDKLSVFGGNLRIVHRHSLPPHGFSCRKYRKMRKTFRWTPVCHSPSPSDEASGGLPSPTGLQVSDLRKNFSLDGNEPRLTTSPPVSPSKSSPRAVTKIHMPPSHSITSTMPLLRY